MKKINIFLMAALTLGFASCDDTSDLGIAQVNPQLPSIEIDGFSISGMPTSVNLDATVNQTIPVAAVVAEPGNLPEGSTIKLEMQLASDMEFSNPTVLNVVDGAVSSDEWEDFVLKQGSKSPAIVTNYVRFAAYLLTNGQLTRLGGEDKWYGETAVAVTPVDLRLDVESAYYFVTSTGKEKLDHSDAHVYDDPIFTYSFELTEDQVPYSWQIAPGSKENGGDADFYGVSETGDASALEGNLELGAQKGVLSEAGKYTLTANMLDKTYKFDLMVAPDTDYLWTPGPANGWGFNDNMLLSNLNDGTFGGYVYIDSKFKLCAQPDWSPLNWGLNGGVMTPGGADIEVDPNGLYYVVANFNDMTVGLTQISSISVIGAFNGWGGDVALTPNATYSVWSGDVDFTEAGGWKFRMNNDWTLNLGGSVDNLIGGGPDLNVSETGTYTVTLDLSKLPYSCTVVKK